MWPVWQQELPANVSRALTLPAIGILFTWGPAPAISSNNRGRAGQRTEEGLDRLYMSGKIKAVAWPNCFLTTQNTNWGFTFASKTGVAKMAARVVASHLPLFAALTQCHLAATGWPTDRLWVGEERSAQRGGRSGRHGFDLGFCLSPPTQSGQNRKSSNL